MKPSAQWLHNGRKLHLQHGPIDLIIEVTASSPGAEQSAYQLAIDRFQTVLTELVAELPDLRSPTNINHCRFNGSIAQRMWRAASTFAPFNTEAETQCLILQKEPTTNDARQQFSQGATTPMIAVAGSVADEIVHAILADTELASRLQKISVNNGGDIALYLGSGQRYRVGIVSNPDEASLCASLIVDYRDTISGIATSGWHGRSMSLGIADSVTVLAASAALADTAATLIANAVRIAEPATDSDTCSRYIERCPARQLDPDTDLGDTLVTTQVKPLPQPLINQALDAGCELASRLESNNAIAGACLFLQGNYRAVGGVCAEVTNQLQQQKPVVNRATIGYGHSVRRSRKIPNQPELS